MRQIRSNASPTNSEFKAYPRQGLKEKLHEVGLRPTRQRVSLACILFGKGNRHVTAESLFEEAMLAGLPVSLATVYNTLRQFTDAGLLRRIAIDAHRTHFDTNRSTHHHFFLEDKEDLVDIVADGSLVSRVPIAPTDYEIARVDVIVRLRRKRA